MRGVRILTFKTQKQSTHFQTQNKIKHLKI